MFDEILGRLVRLRVRELDDDGAWLVSTDDQDPDSAAVLLPGEEVLPDHREGALVEVFVHLDSDERPVATIQTPKLERGEVSFLEVTAVTDIGAFVDWGLGKELLVPFAEQSRELYVGERHPIGLYLDKSGRLAGSMFVNDFLGQPRRVAREQWLEGEAWRDEPEIGLFAILERSYVGLVPASEPHLLGRGDATKFRVTNILPDGKLVLSLRKPKLQEMDADGKTILAVLSRSGAPSVGDHSSPEVIRELFGLSKKAFKRAVGRLLKQGDVLLDETNRVVVVRRA